ncbi:MAG: nucleotidyltransferase domain-containing protein [Candidatus Bathyarchaeota archaeon]|nr:MAG: nucleotidyltransferase domain-containing protein [Candidatus Bathyarchaeota archaeon]
MNVDSDLRCKIAREAATLLYFGAEKEYKQAKLKAAKTLGVHFLPSNLEVAVELDKIVEANEGPARNERLIQMRKEALKIMKTLKEYRPLLIGSVWRGTIRKGSDIDITLYHDVPGEILNLIKKKGIKTSKSEWTTATKKGKPQVSFHIYTETSGKQMVEIVVRSSEAASRKRKCEIFGDELKGLNVQELERLLEENPARKFIPL